MHVRWCATANTSALAGANNTPKHMENERYFRHYKGNYYRMLGVARHSETLDELVVYQALYGERGLWVRPRQMFFETVVVDGHTVARFQEVEKSALPPEVLAD